MVAQVCDLDPGELDPHPGRRPPLPQPRRAGPPAADAGPLPPAHAGAQPRRAAPCSTSATRTSSCTTTSTTPRSGPRSPSDRAGSWPSSTGRIVAGPSGDEGERLPWRLPDDLRRFQALTRGTRDHGAQDLRVHRARPARPAQRGGHPPARGTPRRGTERSLAAALAAAASPRPGPAAGDERPVRHRRGRSSTPRRCLSPGASTSPTWRRRWRTADARFPALDPAQWWREVARRRTRPTPGTPSRSAT